MDDDIRAVTQFLGAYAENRRDFSSAEPQYKALAEQPEKAGIQSGLAGAYHQLGNVAAQRHDFDTAELAAGGSDP